MRLIWPCMKCLFESPVLQGGDAAPRMFLRADLDDDGVLSATCASGHHSRFIIQNPKYEILFESGAHALLDGYTNEAVSSFAVALERFFEFYLRIICRKNELEQKHVDHSWGTISKQSERQFGAFCFLYMMTTGRAFRIPSAIADFK